MRSSELRLRAASALAFVALGCHGSRGPREPSAHAFTLEIGRASGSLRGVASGAGKSFASITVDAKTTLEARTGSSVAWRVELDGRGGPLAVTSDGLLLAALSGTGHLAAQPIRGEPSAAVIARDAETGATRWLVPFEASEWSVVNGIATSPDGIIVGGAFSGSLRVGAKVVTSAGKSDGFVAKLSTSGEPLWLVRFGGGNADAIQGVAARGTRIAIAGTYAASAELQGTPLPAFDEKTPFTDAFVAVLDAAGHRIWISTFGGKSNDSVAGVTIDDGDRVVVAATARESVHIGGSDLVARGPSDGLVASWAPDATFLHAALIGGDDTDGLTGIVSVGDHVVVGGYFSGTARLGDKDLTAGGGDDAFFAAVDYGGSVLDAWPIHGDGREEITALVPAPGGFIAGIAHTGTVTIGSDTLPAPSVPTGGFAIVAR